MSLCFEDKMLSFVEKTDWQQHFWTMLCRSLNEDRSPAKNMLLLLLLLLALFVLSKQRIIYQMDVAVNNRSVMRWFFLTILRSNSTSNEFTTFISSRWKNWICEWLAILLWICELSVWHSLSLSIPGKDSNNKCLYNSFDVNKCISSYTNTMISFSEVSQVDISSLLVHFVHSLLFIRNSSTQQSHTCKTFQ